MPRKTEVHPFLESVQTGTGGKIRNTMWVFSGSMMDFLYKEQPINLYLQDVERKSFRTVQSWAYAARISDAYVYHQMSFFIYTPLGNLQINLP